MSRVARAMRAVSWKYALGELLLIFLGVMIALGASAWWQSREDDRRAEQYKTAIKADLHATIVSLDSMLRLDSTSLWNGRRINAYLTSSAVPLPPHDSIVAWLRLMYPRFEPITATIDQLLQTGDLNLLDNAELRHRITYYAGIMASAHQQIELIEMMFQQQSTLARERTQMHATWEGPWAGPVRSPTDRKVTYDLEGLRRDPILRAAYTSTVLQQSTHMYIMRKVRRETVTMLTEMGDSSKVRVRK